MKKIIIILCFFISSIFATQAKSIIDSVCYACHGEKMELSCYGVSQVPNTLNESYIKSALKEYKNGLKNDYGMGAVMQSQVGGLSDAEIDALAKYIPTLK